MNDTTIDDDEANTSLLDVNKDGEIDLRDAKIVILRYEWILLSGILLIIVPIVDMTGYYPISDTVYWMLAGVCLSVEAIIELYLDRKRRDW